MRAVKAQTSQSAENRQSLNSSNTYTRGIWKALSMIFYLKNRFTNPIMFGIILKGYLSSMLWHTFHEDIIMQTRKNIIVNTCTVCILENTKFQWKI